jgi:hypothetical protein
MYDRAASQAATGEFEDATACRMLRDSSSGLSGSPVVPGHRSNMGGHTFRGQVESHPFGSGGLAFGDARFMCLEDCLKVAGFGICPSLTGKASDLDLNDLPRLQEIASHGRRSDGGRLR